MEASAELLEGDGLDGQDLTELGEEVCNVEDAGHMVRLLGRVQRWNRHIKATCSICTQALALCPFSCNQGITPRLPRPGLLQSLLISEEVDYNFIHFYPATTVQQCRLALPNGLPRSVDQCRQSDLCIKANIPAKLSFVLLCNESTAGKCLGAQIQQP